MKDSNKLFKLSFFFKKKLNLKKNKLLYFSKILIHEAGPSQGKYNSPPTKKRLEYDAMVDALMQDFQDSYEFELSNNRFIFVIKTIQIHKRNMIFIDLLVVWKISDSYQVVYFIGEF